MYADRTCSQRTRDTEEIILITDSMMVLVLDLHTLDGPHA
jgi:hypothetical protein